MKKLSFLLCFLPLLINAQIDFGIKAGLNQANASYTINVNDGRETPELFSPNSISGIYAGLFVKKPIGAKIKLETELLYSMKGYGIREPGRISLNEMTLPISLLYSFKNFSIGVGHEVGYLLSSRNSNGPKIDLSMLGSLSFQMSRFLAIDFRVIQGYKSVTRIGYADTNNVLFGTGGVKTRVLQIGLNYKIYSSRHIE